jgi:hypothetical protein
MNVMSRDFFATSANVTKAVALFDLAAEPAELFVGGMNGGIDFAGLMLGTRYRLKQDLRANRAGALAKGEKVHFLGFQSLNDKGLRLFFERAGAKVTLEFDCAATPAEGQVGRIHRGADHMAPVWLDLSKRSKRLLAARAVLIHLKSRGVSDV